MPLPAPVTNTFFTPMLLIVTVRLFAKSQSDSTHHPMRPRLFASSWLKTPAEAQKQWDHEAHRHLHELGLYGVCAESGADMIGLVGGTVKTLAKQVTSFDWF
jgi:hypothetical protein